MHTRSACALAFVATLLLTACPSKTPEQQVAETRDRYVVQLNAWRVVEPPADEMMADDTMAEGEMAGEAMAVATEAAAMAGEAAEEMAEGEEMDEEMAAGPGPATVFFDLIVRFDGREPLPGITVDITHADPFEKEKAVVHHWVETGDMHKAETRQVSFEREFEDYEEGDVFSVALRSHVPAAEHGDYREFAEAAP